MQGMCTLSGRNQKQQILLDGIFVIRNVNSEIKCDFVEL